VNEQRCPVVLDAKPVSGVALFVQVSRDTFAVGRIGDE